MEIELLCDGINNRNIFPATSSPARNTLLAHRKRQKGGGSVRKNYINLFSVSANKTNIFRKSLIYYRGGENENVRKELQQIVCSKEAKCHHSNRSFTGIVTSGQFWRPFSCVGAIFILFRLSSFSVLSHYTAPFLDRAGISLDPLLASVIIGVFRLVSSLTAFALFAFVTKRTAFILGGFTSTFGMLLGK